MKSVFLGIAFALIAAPALHAIDDFNVQMSKNLHEDVSMDNDIYTVGQSAKLWNSESQWLQRPNAAFRFIATHQEHFMGYTEGDLYSPMIDLNFQTFAGVKVGIAYAHGFASDEQVILGSVRKFEVEGDLDSVGGYVAKQFDCGFKIGGTWSYSTGDLGPKGTRFPFEFDTAGGSGMIGYARNFGDKQTWKNVFVDTSANFIYQSEEKAWYFLWMAKAGHNFCERCALYGIFNLYHELDYGSRRFGVPPIYASYRPYGDETWGEAGGGFQVQIIRGLTLTAEATTPVFDDYFITNDSFQVRSALNFSF